MTEEIDRRLAIRKRKRLMSLKAWQVGTSKLNTQRSDFKRFHICVVGPQMGDTGMTNN